MSTFNNKTFTFTFGDCAENHVGMQKIGITQDSGYSYEDILNFKTYFDSHDCKTELINLQYENNKAYFLVIRNGMSVFLNKDDDLFKEHNDLKKDTQAIMYGRVVNKLARHNLCYAEKSQVSDLSAKKGTVVAYNDVPLLSKIRKGIINLSPKNSDIVVEGNFYYDVKKCGIGYHGDAERSKVIGLRVGETFPLCFQWYHMSSKFGDQIRIDLSHGDMYVMCDKATGRDWKKRNLFTLRHAAGADKYINPKLKKKSPKKSPKSPTK